MKQYYIYKITSPSGKVYIGQTKNPKSRLNEYKWKCTSKQALIYNSVIKYGYDNHIIEIFLTRYTREEVNEEEIRLIKIYKDLSTSLNISDGGQLVSQIRKRKILKCDLQGSIIQEYNSLVEANKAEKLGVGTLNHALKKKLYYCKNYLWIYKDDWEKGERPIWKANLEGKSTRPLTVNQFDLEGNFIRKYDSAEEAGRVLGIKATSISANIRGTTKRVHKFIFSKEEKVNKYLNKRKNDNTIQ
jgi:group I intron endonuclease